jgi:hypothetical protein
MWATLADWKNWSGILSLLQSVEQSQFSSVLYPDVRREGWFHKQYLSNLINSHSGTMNRSGLGVLFPGRSASFLLNTAEGCNSDIDCCIFAGQQLNPGVDLHPHTIITGSNPLI